MQRISKIRDILVNLDSSPIYICGHINPDQDSIGSCLSLALFLNAIGKKAFVLLNETDYEILDWKKDYTLIKSSILEKDYNFIALDLNEISRLGKYKSFFDDAKFRINIDHHQDNKYEADCTYSDTTVSATCEIIYKIIYNYDKTMLTKDICEYLYSGILNDTHCFCRRLSNNTLKISQELINKGIDYQNIIKKTFSQRTLYEYKALAKLINSIKYDTFHYVVIDKSDADFINLTHNQIVKKIAEDLRTIEGMDVFILLVKNKNTILGKCMSNISENANIIAGLFGGGGHKKEAGFTVSNIDVVDILSKIKTFLSK